VAAGAIGPGFTQFDNGSRLNQQTPCNAALSAATVAESDRSFQSTGADGNPVIVNLNVAQFAGGADAYLNALATAVGSCGRYRTQQNGLDVTDTITRRGSGAVLGDGPVVRYEIQLLEPSNVVVVEEVTAFRKGEVVALVAERRLNQGDAADTERIAGLVAARL